MGFCDIVGISSDYAAFFRGHQVNGTVCAVQTKLFVWLMLFS